MGLFVTSSGTNRHGVFATEVTPPAVVRGSGSRVVACVGQLPWGPTGEVVEPTSLADARLMFAPPGMSRTGTGYLAFFTAKTFGAMRVVRVVGTTAAKATATLVNAVPTNLITLTAKYKGVAGNSLSAVVSDASDGDANHFDLAVSITGASGSWTDTLKNVNYSGVGTETSLTQAQLDVLKLIGAPTKLASGRPTNGTYTFSSGSEGTAAATDYVGTAGSGDAGMALLEGDPAVRIVITDDPGNSLRAAVNAGLVAHAIRMGDRVAFMNGPSGQSASAARTNRATFTATDRLVYFDPWCYEYDDVTAAEQLVQTAPFAASIASYYPESTSIAWKAAEVQALLAGIVRLEAARGEAAGTNTDNGVATFIKEISGGHTIEADVTAVAPTSPSLRKLTRRRVTDAIAIALTTSLRDFVDAANVPQNRLKIRTAVNGYLGGLKRAQNGDPDHSLYILDYAILPDSETNTQESLDAGKYTLGIRVKDGSSMEQIFFQIESGESVNITTT